MAEALLPCGLVICGVGICGSVIGGLEICGFLTFITLALDRYLNMDLDRTYYNILLLPVTGLIGTVFGIYLTYVEAFIIHQWCPFCLIAFGLTLAATFFSLREYGTDLKEYFGEK